MRMRAMRWIRLLVGPDSSCVLYASFLLSSTCRSICIVCEGQLDAAGRTVSHHCHVPRVSENDGFSAALCMRLAGWKLFLLGAACTFCSWSATRINNMVLNLSRWMWKKQETHFVTNWQEAWQSFWISGNSVGLSARPVSLHVGWWQLRTSMRFNLLASYRHLATLFHACFICLRLLLPLDSHWTWTWNSFSKFALQKLGDFWKVDSAVGYDSLLGSCIGKYLICNDA